MNFRNSIVTLLALALMTSTFWGEAFAFRPIRINANNSVLFGTDLSQDELTDGTDPSFNGFNSLLEPNTNNIRYNILIVPWLTEGGVETSTDITIAAGTHVRMAQNKSIIVGDNVSFVVDGEEGNRVIFGNFNANDLIGARWLGALIIDEQYNWNWRLNLDPDGWGQPDEETDGINIDINNADFVLGGAVQNTVSNYPAASDWGSPHWSRAGAAVFLRSTRPDPDNQVFLFRNSKIVGSFSPLNIWRSPANPGDGGEQYKALEVHGDGNPELNLQNDWLNAYGGSYDGQIIGAWVSNFQNCEIIGWDTRWNDSGDNRQYNDNTHGGDPIQIDRGGGSLTFTSANVEVFGDNFRFTNVKICPDREMFLVQERYGNSQVMHQILVSAYADNTMFDRCFFAQSHLETICIEGKGTIIDNCEATYFHHADHSHLIDVKPRDADNGNVWTVIRNSIIWYAQDEGIHHSNGVLWAFNNLIHSCGREYGFFFEDQNPDRWNTNSGITIHPGYRTASQRIFNGDVFCEPHIFNNTLINNAVGISVWPHYHEDWNNQDYEMEEGSQIYNNIIYKGKHWNEEPRGGGGPRYEYNKFAIWYSEDPRQLADHFLFHNTFIWSENGQSPPPWDNDNTDARGIPWNLPAVVWWSGQEPRDVTEWPAIIGGEVNGWAEINENISADVDNDGNLIEEKWLYFDSYFTDRDGNGFRTLNHGVNPTANNGIPNLNYVGLHQGRDGVMPLDFHLYCLSRAINTGFGGPNNIWIDPDDSPNNIGFVGARGFLHFDQGHLNAMAEYFAGWNNWVTSYSTIVNFHCIVPSNHDLGTGSIVDDVYHVLGEMSLAANTDLTIDEGVEFEDNFDVTLGDGSKLIVKNTMDNILGITGRGSLTFDADVEIQGINLDNNPDAQMKVLIKNNRTLSLNGDITLGAGYSFEIEGGGSLIFENEECDITINGGENSTSAFKAKSWGGGRVYIGGPDGAEEGDWGMLSLMNALVSIYQCDIMHGGAGGQPMIDITNCDVSIQQSDISQSAGSALRLNSWTAATVNNNSIHDAINGIEIGAGSPPILTIRNNFIYGTTGDADNEHGIGIFCQDEGRDVRIHNNILFNTSSHGVRLGVNSSADIIYMTIHHPSNGHCISIQGDGSGAEQVFNNVFSEWNAGGGFRAVAYEEDHQQSREGLPADRIDYNVYCDLELNYLNRLGQAGEGLYTAHAILNNRGPQQVAFERWRDDGEHFDYNPWLGVNDEHDDVACQIWSDYTTANDLDFHLYEGFDGGEPPIQWHRLGGLPCFHNRAFHAGQWWSGFELDGPPVDADVRVPAERYGPPDAGAYGGPLADNFVGTPVSIEGIGTDWDKPFIIVDFLPLWLWEGNGLDHREYVRPSNEMFDWPNDAVIPAGIVMEVPADFGINIRGPFNIAGESDNRVSIYCGEFNESWDGFTVTSSMVAAHDINISYCDISWADYGFYLSGLQSSMGSMQIDHSVIDSCGTAVYSNNSRLSIKNSTITRSHDPSLLGKGIYLTNTTAGQVLIDNSDFTANGIDGTVQCAGIFLSSANPEIVRSRIYNNSGAGIYAYASSPDINTYDYLGATTRHNDIYENGTGSQGGGSPNGSEIYLVGMSSPDIRYNNIHEFDLSPNGYAIYMDDLNLVWLNAWQNWWGTAYPDLYESQLFHYGTGAYILYSPWEDSPIVDNVDDYERAMVYWDRGEFEEAARLLRQTVSDTGAIGVNSIHYLTGCVYQMEEDLAELRSFFQDITADHNDARVARSARRYATHCLTLLGNYEEAMEEYDRVREEAECLQDSIAAALDWLAVRELVRGNEVNSLGDYIPRQMSKLLAMLNQRPGDSNIIYPENFIVNEVYPNPFNDAALIRFNLKEAGKIKIAVYDIQGREVSVVLDGIRAAGTHVVNWNASGFSSGVYFCKLQSGSNSKTVKLTLVR